MDASGPSPSALSPPPAAPSADQVMAPACAGGYWRRGARGWLGSCSGGRTYTTFFCVVLPCSEPTAAARSDGTRLTMTLVFFHTMVASSEYSSSFCAFVSSSSHA